MKTWLCDDWSGVSVYIDAPDWDTAQERADEMGLTLIGEHVPITDELAQPPLWLTIGETLQ